MASLFLYYYFFIIELCMINDNRITLLLGNKIENE